MPELKLEIQKPPYKRKPLDRQPYLELIKLTNLGLCNFCKFAEWDGGGCCDSSLMCQHELIGKRAVKGEEFQNEVWAGDGDCWAFRPSESLQQIGVFVGIYLEDNIPHYSTSHKGEIIAITPSKRDKAERYW